MVGSGKDARRGGCVIRGSSPAESIEHVRFICQIILLGVFFLWLAGFPGHHHSNDGESVLVPHSHFEEHFRDMP